MSTKTRWVLILSLALNLVLLTALATWTVVHRLHDRAEMAGVPGLPSPRVLMRHLEQDERERLREALRRQAPAFRSEARAAAAARREIEQTLLAEPFDPAALESAMARARTHAGGLAEGAQRAIAELAESLDRDGRERLAKALGRHAGRAQHEHHAREGRHERRNGDKDRD